MGLFLSTFVNKVDSKGRVSVPASFRSALSQEPFQGIIVYRSYKYDALECCGYSRMESLSQTIDAQTDIFSQTQDDLTAAIFADSVQIPFDGDGRIVMPKSLCDFAGIADRAAFVGRGQTFQIWLPEAFESHQTQARERVRGGEISLRMHKVGSGGQGGAS